jgi:2-keto-4-pentenoate hydratase/2-oxohepta-3-ene-1,7-dioic acid hydratase in catechol pathway
MIFTIAEVVSYLSQVSASLLLGSLLTINRDTRCYQAR